MAKLRDVLNMGGGGDTRPLSELSIKPGTQEIVRVFSEDAVTVNLHYESDDATVQGYFICLGDSCPYCKAGFKPVPNHLLPVFSVTTGAVAVLRMSDQQGPTKLLSLFASLLDDPTLADKIVVINRRDRYNYQAETRPAEKHKTLGAKQIGDFAQAMSDGKVDLTAIYPRHSVETLRAVPKVKLSLDLLSGETTPKAHEANSPEEA